MSALRECPFCKTTRLHLDNFTTVTDDYGNITGVTDWRVMHDEGQSCDVWGPEYATREEAIAAWNRRAGDAEVEKLRAEVARLRCVLKWLATDSVDPDSRRMARAALEDNP